MTDIHDFRGEHFEIDDYDPHPAIPGIPVLDLMVSIVVAQGSNRVIGARRRAAVAAADRHAPLPRADDAAARS